LLASVARIRAALRRSPTPFEAALAIAAISVTLYVAIAPLTVSRYPPMTDLPFHATFGATFRHYWDPAYHLREQFRLSPFRHPYMSLYALIAAGMLVFPMMAAVRIAVVIHLLLVPAGLSVFFLGAKKSPLLGLLGLGLVYGNLTHWGFINYVGACGLFVMVVGLTLLLLDRPTRGRQIGLSAALVALYFTHIFRFPFAVAAVVGTGVVMFPATRRVRPLVVPVLVAVALFAAWWKLRPPSLEGAIDVGFHGERLANDFGNGLMDGFKDSAVRDAQRAFFATAGSVALVSAAYALAARVRRRRRFTAWDVGVTVVPLACAAVFLALFLTLPLFIGSWFYVFPREATASVLVLSAACPDLPRAAWLRAPLIGALSIAGISVTRQVSAHYAELAQTSEDLYTITRHIGLAPRLFYTVVDHTPTSRTVSPFSHLPAYVQAERGGWLSWSFAVWGHSPVTYRAAGDPLAVLAPPPPLWDPKYDKPFYDWILFRQETSPDGHFVRDPAIQRVAHVGRWWLYHRVR
jgi:hypothetical protein